MRYSFMAFSNPINADDATYVKWYAGQHAHDLLRIPGFVGARFYTLADHQFGGSQPHRYLMIWDIETDDLEAVFADVAARLADGRTVLPPFFDLSTFNSITVRPVSGYVTADAARGKSPDEIYAIAMT